MIRCITPIALAAALNAVGAASAAPHEPGCAASIARTQAIVESDVATQNLNAVVGQRFRADLARAAAACASGHDTEARGLLAGAKARYGYR